MLNLKEARRTLNPRASRLECSCQCESCVAGDCSNCMSTACTDTNCEDCPMQAKASAASSSIRGTQLFPHIRGGNRLDEVMRRFGSRPALIRMASVSDYFGDSAPYSIEGGIAMIDISGPLSNSAWSWGGTTYGDIQDQCKIAMADPEVKGALLCINSPGGETDNAFETAVAIAKLASQKPVYAVAGTMAYSAAYLLACQASKIFCSPTSGGVGSVGVWAAHMDYSDMLKQMGIKPTLFSAGEGKTDGNPYEPLSDAAKLSIQADIDRLYGEFVGAVATGRKMAPTDVVKLGARTYEGSKAAISSGLADMPGDVTDAWAALCLAVEDDDDDDDLGQYPLMQAAREAQRVASATKDKNKMTAAEKATTEKALADAAQAKTTAAASTQLLVGETSPTAEEIQTLVTEARNGGFAEAGLIADMCAIAGSTKATDYIRQKKTVKDVTAELLAEKVAADAKTAIDSSVNVKPAKKDEGATAFGTPKPWGEITSAIGGKQALKP